MLIKGGTIVNDDAIWKADVLIKDGKIWAIGNDLKCDLSGDQVINATGKYIFPGGIDAHTHLKSPFANLETADDFYSGTRAALAGGTTTVMDFVVDTNVSLLTAYESWKITAKEKACCDYALHVVVVGWSKEIEQDMTILVKEKGINSFKMFMTYPGLQVNDEDLLKIFRHIRKIGALALIHAENGDAITMNQERLLRLGATGPECHLHSRPEELEAEATHRAIVLANQVLCPLYVVHVMSKTSVDVIAKKRNEGCLVFGETVASALGVDGRHYFNKCWKHAAAFIMSPPLRADPETPNYLMDMLSSGVLEVTGSDNCTFNSEQKELGKNDFTKIPNGVNGVEDRMSVIWENGVMTGKLDLCKYVAVTSTNAAKIFNIYPQKGRIAIGSDADIVIWDPKLERTISVKTHHQKVDFNVFEGMKIHGGPTHVFSRGRLVINHGKVNVVAGSGQFLPTPPYSRPAYCRFQQNPCHTIDVVNREDTNPVTCSKLLELQEGYFINKIKGNEANNCQNPHRTFLGQGLLHTESIDMVQSPPAKSAGVL